MLAWLKRFLLGREALPATTPAGAMQHPDSGAAASTEDPLEAALQRQDIFDREGRATGYLMQLRDAAPTNLRKRAGVRALLDGVLIRELRNLVAHWPAERGCHIALGPVALADPQLAELAPLRVTVLLDLDLRHPPRDSLIQHIVTLRRAGLRIALEAQPGLPGFEALASRTDVFIQRFEGQRYDALRRTATLLGRQYPQCQQMAVEVSDPEELELAHQLGCVTVSGNFSQLRGDWNGRRMLPEQLRVAELLNHLDDASTTPQIAEALRQDIGLSYRVLRYVNAAANGLQTPAGTVEQALLILGRTRLYRWLSLLFFTSRDAPGGSPLMEAALVRGRMMELMAGSLSPKAREELFMLGIFSLLDLMLKLPMSEAISPLHLPDGVSAALLTRSGPYAAYLDAAESCEKGELQTLMRAATQISLRPMRISQMHFEALAWAQALGDMREAPVQIS